MRVEEAVLKRYSRGAERREEELCCPVEYDARYLKAIPAEIIERDYGCGDPSAHLRSGETVLDLGSGGGKICYIAAQVVGASGRVIGVDLNRDMLDLARRHQPEVARRLGYDNVRFLHGRIQDLRTDLDAVDRRLAECPIGSAADLAAFDEALAEQRQKRPLVRDESVDVVVSNCVLNLVGDEEKEKLVSEIFRVLRRGGRAVISDIVSDEPVPAALKADPDLWSGCIAGAFHEAAFIEAFTAAGFYGVEILVRDARPWRTVRGIEFRSVTVRAWKGKEGDTREPYARDLIAVEPLNPVAAADAEPFDCSRDAIRRPRETKGLDDDATTQAPSGCDGNGSCC
jgi:SAM-dependent methyltransferase